jgi:hypothetical protein
MSGPYYVDSAAANDTGDGLSWGTAKKTLQAAANLTGPAVVNVKNNGWTNPYFLTAQVDTKSNGTSGNHWQWNFNAAGTGATHGAVVTPLSVLNTTWTLVGGTSYVYRTAMAVNPNRIFSTGGDDGWLVENILPREWLKRTTQPNDSNDHHFWYDSTNLLLYICDHSGDPGASGVSLFHGQALCQWFNIVHDYYDILGGMFFATGWGFDVSKPTILFDGCSMWYPYNSNFILRTGSGSATGGSIVRNCLSVVSPINGSYYGHARCGDTIAGNSFLNNTFYGGALGFRLMAKPSAYRYVMKNNIYADLGQGVYQPSTTWDDFTTYINEDYNAFGIASLSLAQTPYTFQGTGSIGGHSITDGGATASALDLKFQNPIDFDFSLLAASPCINKGTDLGLVSDYRGKSRCWGKAPDLGVYEMRLSQNFF